MSLPYPVPPAVLAEADALGGTADGPGKAHSLPVFTLQILGANNDILFSSPPLTGNQLKRYVYEFNVKVNPLKWRMRLILEWVYQGLTYRYSKTFTVDVGTVTPKGDGARVRVAGKGANATSSANDLRAKLALAVKRKSPGETGFSSSRPVRPNESETDSRLKNNWLRFGFSGPWQEGVPTYPTFVKRSRVWTGTRTPGFGGLKAKRLPVNPHTVSMRNTVMGPSVFASYNNANGNTSGSITLHTQFYPGASVPTHLGSAQTKALQRLMEASGQDRQNLAETVATFGQTVDMVSGNITKIVRTLKALKKGNFPEALKQLYGNANPRYRRKSKGLQAGKDTASNWLELQYGWKPLIQDVHWAMQKLAKVDLNEFPIVRTAASAKTKAETSEDVLMHLANPGRAGSKIIKTQTTVRYVVYWRLHSQLLSLLSQAGFTNPVSLAWELLPFSFVADWFYPIGPYLEQFSAFEGLEFLGGSRTSFTKQWTDFALDYDRQSPFNASQRDWGTSRYHDEWIILDREKLTGFPGPVIPSVKNGLRSVTHIVNGIALMRAMLR